MTKRSKFLLGRGFNLKSVEDFTLLLMLLDLGNKQKIFTKLAAIFGDDFVVFLEIFAGKSIPVPSITKLVGLSSDIEIWRERNNLGECEETYKKISEKFDIPVEKAKVKCEMIDAIIEIEEENNGQ